MKITKEHNVILKTTPRKLAIVITVNDGSFSSEIKCCTDVVKFDIINTNNSSVFIKKLCNLGFNINNYADKSFEEIHKEYNSVLESITNPFKVKLGV